MTQFGSSSLSGSVLAKVSWTYHLVLLSQARTEEEREFYIRLCIQEKCGVKQQERQNNSGVFDKVMLENQSQPQAIKGLNQNVVSVFRDSYMFEFLNLSEPHSEGALPKDLIAQIRSFILELGRNFLFVGEEYRLQIGNSDFYIDLLFYHKASLSGLLTATNTFSLSFPILAAASKTFISAFWVNIHFLLYTLEIPVFA